MRASRWSIHVLLGVTTSAFVVALASTVAPAARAQVSRLESRSSGSGGARATQPAYVGEDTCLTCHTDMTRGYHDSAHGRAANARSPKAARGCESCHGPGGAHVENPAENPMLRFKRVDASEASAACLTCHRRGDHALWEGSPHEVRDLSCVTCHSIHTPQSGEDRPRMPGGGTDGREAAASGPRAIGSAQLVATSEMELCAKCHRDKVVKLDRSGHMPVREGKMQCSTCHNPHGSMNVRNLRAGHSLNESCTSCHADKRGPYLWEHAPVTESCTTCHDPHGSANERMLIAKLPMLCQRCHIHTRHPSTIYDGAVIGTSNRLYARSCVTCHSNIHGSNHASGSMFVR